MENPFVSKATVLLFVLSLFVLANVIHAAESTAITIEGIKLGDTEKAIIAKLGKPEVNKNGYIQYKKKGLEFELAGGKAFSITASGPFEAKLDSGVGIGSTEDQVKKSYPKHKSATMNEDENHFYSEEGPAKHLQIVVKKGKVIKLFLTDCEEC